MLLLVLFGVGFGAVAILKDIQKLELVSFPSSPLINSQQSIVIDTVPSEFSDSFDTSSYLDNESLITLYTSQELSAPILEPRDGPISQLEPKRISALDFFESDSLNVPNELASEVDSDLKSDLQILSDPVLHTEPILPTLELFAATPAWVRITDDEGSIVFEKTLESNEKHAVDNQLFAGFLRSGNATNVFFVIDGDAWGPLSDGPSVVKKVPLNPLFIKSQWKVSEAATALYQLGFEEEKLVDTALKSNE